MRVAVVVVMMAMTVIVCMTTDLYFATAQSASTFFAHIIQSRRQRSRVRSRPANRHSYCDAGNFRRNNVRWQPYGVTLVGANAAR